MNDTTDTIVPALPGEGMAALEQANRHAAADREFRADLNQKLRTPLNAIIGFAELLSLRPATAKENSDVQHILTAAHELLEIVNRELNETPFPPAATNVSPLAAAPSCDVLYVEDDPVNFMLIERIFEFRPKLKLAHARTGESGIELAQAQHPRLILLDLNLPDLHGSEVLERLQNVSETARIPVIILSADATPSQIERLLSAGARNYVTKPFDLDPFLAVVDETLAPPADPPLRWN